MKRMFNTLYEGGILFDSYDLSISILFIDKDWALTTEPHSREQMGILKDDFFLSKYLLLFVWYKTPLKLYSIIVLP